ncbi:integrase catalytic domain-containing protein [Pseudoscourfieldia marina]
MDAAADDGMQLWTALKREIDITLPSARSHAEDQLKTKTKQKHDETVAEFGLRFRGAVREFKNRGGEMTNYKYAELFAANVHERHQRIALELVTDLDPTTTTRSSYPTSSVAPTNARPYTIVSYAQIQKTADAALHYPCKGAAVAVTAAAWAAEEAATPNVLTRSDTNDAAKTQTVQLHTLTTLRCVMRLAARVTTQHVGAATPTQAAEVAVDEADIKVAEADEEDDTRCTTDASYHGIGGTQQYLPPPPPLPSQLMQNNIARVGEAFPTMNAPPPTGQMYQTGPYRRTFAITLATNEPNCSKYIVDEFHANPILRLEDGTLLHPAHIFYPELARTKVSKSACVFNIGTKIGPGGRRIAKTSVPHAPSTNLMEIGGELDTHSQKTTHSALDYAFATDVGETPGFEPRTYEEAIHSKDHERWILAIDSELNSHQLNGTWIVIDNDGTVKNLIGCKWVFKIKLNSDGSIARYKARLVAQGFSQIHGVDYSETYAPVVQYQTLRTLLAIYSARGFYFGQIDVETAYLYALVQELIYMRPPKGTNYGPNKICRLLKSLYGLKQAGRNCAVGTENEIWILVYVDDIIFASKNEQTKDIFAGHLRKKYRITEPAQLTWALGMKVSFAADGIILTQDLYVSKILERFGFTSAAKSATTPLAHGTTLTRADEEDAEARHLAQQFVGAILYAAVISRPDLSSTVRVMSHVMSKPPSNFEACKKHVLRYLSGTINRGIKYNTNSNVPLKLIGYCDASWGDNHENRRSTSGYIFFLNGGPISWASYLQTTVALSTVESEVMALTEAIKEAIYIRRLLESLGAAQEGPTIIYTDSTGAEALVDHPTSHRRTKHIEIRREFIKFHIGHETVKIERVSTKDQLADILTKPLRQDIHNYLVQMILHG